ncbi:hypothetical protein BH09BAC5_BH09BAC5_13840 [soil metagenome]
MNKRPLAPKFLNKLDNYLLLNRPDTWSVRFHLVLYYFLLFSIVFAGICFVIPTDHRQNSFYGLWSGSAGVLALIGFIVWLVYLFRFNVFKQFGKVFPGDRIKTFVLYFFILVMMIVVIYIPPVVECIRADQAYATEELAIDLNRVNELVTSLERDQIPGEWQPDTLIRVNHVDYSSSAQAYSDGLQYVDTADYRIKIQQADSVKHIRDGVSIIYEFFNLRFVNEYRITDHAKAHFKTTKELYYTCYLNNSINVSSARNELQQLINKYNTGDRNYYDAINTSDIINHVHEKYNLYNVNSGFDHIADRKYRLQYTVYSDYIRTTYYFALVLSLLVFIFRHSTTKTFFLSLLFGVVLAILSGLFVAVLHLREGGILYLMLFYFVSFVTISIAMFKAKRRTIISGVALNAFTLMTPFVPMICVALYYYAIRESYYSDLPYQTQFYANRAIHFFYSEIGGAFILLLFIETVFKKMYRAWFAAPEE